MNQHDEDKKRPVTFQRASRPTVPSAQAPLLEQWEIEAEQPPVPPDPAEIARLRRLSRRSFLWAALATGGGVGGLIAYNKLAPEDGGTKTPFRRALEFNEAVAQTLFFSPRHRAQEFPRWRAVEPRNNYHGETPEVDLDAWTLTLEGATGGAKTLTLADIKRLPEVSQTTELKCIEGWSAVVNWTGVRFLDFMRAYPPPEEVPYISVASEPEGWDDEHYYVGLDAASCLHPQTLLAYAMNDAPLTPAHGAPLRLVIPHKYGIKNVKLITRIAYARERPADYWAERGYDWYAGL